MTATLQYLSLTLIPSKLSFVQSWFLASCSSTLKIYFHMDWLGPCKYQGDQPLCFAWECPGFSTENPASQETPQPWVNRDIWVPNNIHYSFYSSSRIKALSSFIMTSMFPTLLCCDNPVHWPGGQDSIW